MENDFPVNIRKSHRIGPEKAAFSVRVGDVSLQLTGLSRGCCLLPHLSQRALDISHFPALLPSKFLRQTRVTCVPHTVAFAQSPSSAQAQGLLGRA